MARADLLKKLFRAYRDSDKQSFMDTAYCIVDEERKKHHVILANDLVRILNGGVVAASPNIFRPVQAPPRDQEKKTPLLEVRNPERYLGDLILDKRTERLLKGVMQEFRQWEVLEANGLRPSYKLLFCGPPGCGKTVTAEVMAAELGLPLVYVRFDSVVSSLLGETAANLRRVFEYIRQDTWVVLFDEFDAIGRSRDDVTEHGEIKRVVNSFLQMIDNFDGRSLIIAATNFEQSLDPALWRRFDEIIRFERPSLGDIEELMRIRLAHVKNRRISFKAYARKLEGSSFADVDRVCLAVLKSCVLTGRSRLISEDLSAGVREQILRAQVMRQSMADEFPRVGIE